MDDQKIDIANKKPLTWEQFDQLDDREQKRYMFHTVMPLKEAGYVYFSVRRFGIGLLIMIGTISAAGAGVQWIWHTLITHIKIYL